MAASPVPIRDPHAPVWNVTIKAAIRESGVGFVTLGRETGSIVLGIGRP
ncbi:MAG: hypothetical protein QOG72_2736 [Sphingomonadales bacterium]|jgi:hypothetical protein|nr:hypothetical protein [Sphingomonadales bacterium]